MSAAATNPGKTDPGDAIAVAPVVLRKCAEEMPPLEQKQGEPGHVAACWVTK